MYINISNYSITIEGFILFRKLKQLIVINKLIIKSICGQVANLLYIT